MDKTFIAEKYQQPAPNLLMDIATLASQRTDLIDLSLGDPDITTNQAIIEAAFHDVSAGHTHYTASNGSDDFIQAVLDFYQRHYRLSFKPTEIRASVGALHGMYLALQAILNPGDEVIIHEPYFSPYKEQVEMAGGVPVIIPTYEKDNFEVDIAVLQSAISPKTKAMIINTPNNPTGAVFSKTTMQAIAKLAEDHHFLILADEVYEAFTYQQEYVPMVTYAPKHTLTFSSFSKTFAMTGWRLGYMIIPEDINQVTKLLNEAQTYSAPTPSQRAGIYALNHYESLAADISQLFKTRLDYVKERVDEIAYLSMGPVAGSIYAFIDIQASGVDSVRFAEVVLEKTSVLVIPGLAFGEAGKHHIRLAATQDLTILQTAFDRLATLEPADFTTQEKGKEKTE